MLEGNFVDGMLVESSSDSFVKWVPKTKFSSLELSDGGSYKGMVTRGIDCLLYTSPSPRDATLSRMPSSA